VGGLTNLPEYFRFLNEVHGTELNRVRVLYPLMGIIGLLWVVFCSSCKEVGKAVGQSEWQGSGVTVYNDYEPMSSIPLRVFYYVPQKVHAQSPILFVFHGAERNAIDYRNSLIDQAETKGIILVVPEFSEIHFPGVSSYQIGNVFSNGDSPSTSTLNLESKWTFSLVEPLFAYVKLKTKNTTDSYFALGHSGGAQFLHRLIFFKNSIKMRQAVISAAGWYTVPDNTVQFPYGFKESPFAERDLKAVFGKSVTIQVGSADINTQSSGLRQTPEAKLQGAHRLDRAKYFYENSRTKAQSEGWVFEWKLEIAQGLNHDFVKAVNYGTALLFK
jgi:hypothetical protein